jgi:SAM-dependent methyltransferase
VENIIRPCPQCSCAKTLNIRTVNDWDIVRCADCNFVYVPKLPKTTAFEIEVPDNYEPIWRARHRQIHRLLTRLISPGELVVDIGAGIGELGRVVEASGQFRYVGFEPSRSVARLASTRGVNIRNEIFTSQSLNEPAAAVVLDNVIEHVADPLHLLSESVSVLRGGGVLVVIVPNRWDVRQLVPSWRDRNHWIPPDHINYFTAGSLERSFANIGMRAIPFGFRALKMDDWRYFPRAFFETVKLYPFGLNFFGIRR